MTRREGRQREVEERRRDEGERGGCEELLEKREARGVNRPTHRRYTHTHARTEGRTHTRKKQPHAHRHIKTAKHTNTHIRLHERKCS